MLKRKTPIRRKAAIKRPTAVLRKKPLAKMSAKRKVEKPLYDKLRAEFLAAHPYCQVWLKENGFTEDRISPNGVIYSLSGPLRMWYVPRSTQVHHGAGRYSGNYLKTETWWAVCQEMHEKIHRNPKWARERGYMTR